MSVAARESAAPIAARSLDSPPEERDRRWRGGRGRGCESRRREEETWRRLCFISLIPILESLSFGSRWERGASPLHFNMHSHGLDSFPILIYKQITPLFKFPFRRFRAVRLPSRRVKFFVPPTPYHRAALLQNPPLVILSLSLKIVPVPPPLPSSSAFALNAL